MLEKRVFKPKMNQLLYHYCNADTFHSICTNKTLRFSDIFSSNDSMEFHWGYKIWEKAANKIYEKVSHEFLDKVDEIVGGSKLMSNYLISCFSLEGDVLSQWRGYANDGSGYCIGFDANHLLGLPARPLDVLYDENKQIDEVCEILLKIYENERDLQESDKYGVEFLEFCTLLGANLTAFKNTAFKEENEVRLTHLIYFEKSNNFLKATDSNGVYFNNEIEGNEIKFRMVSGIPVPYIDYNFINPIGEHPIKEVLLGPKNSSLISNIMIYLETLNISNVNVVKSKASYR